MALGEVFALSFLLIFAGWFNINTGLSNDYSTREQAVNNICYRYTQTASDLGVLTQPMFDEFSSKISLYGEFDIKIVAERFENDGSKTQLEGSSVIGLDLRENNYQIVSIYAEAKKRHPLSAVYKMFPFNYDVEYRLIGYSSAYVQ